MSAWIAYISLTNTPIRLHGFVNKEKSYFALFIHFKFRFFMLKIQSDNHFLTEQKILFYQAKILFISSKNSFLSSKYPFYIEHLIRTRILIGTFFNSLLGRKYWPLMRNGNEPSWLSFRRRNSPIRVSLTSLTMTMSMMRSQFKPFVQKISKKLDRF